MKVIVRLRPFTRAEKVRGAENWPRAVQLSGSDVHLGYEPKFSSGEAPSSVGRRLAARVASRAQIDGFSTPPPPERIPLEDRSNNTPTDWEDRCTPPPPSPEPVKIGPSTFSFDPKNVFGPEAATHHLYTGGGLSDLLAGVLAGYNGTIFAFGQTGSGKTYTMDNITDLCVDDIFAFISSKKASSSFLLRASFIEIYNERVTDLLVTGGAPSLRLLDTKSAAGVVVQGLSEVRVDSRETLAEALRAAKLNRMTAATEMNERSSRSHLIVRLTLERRGGGSAQPSQVQVSCLNLVDLAGSERAQEDKALGRQQIKEASSINQSLLCLGNVVSRLAEGTGGHIPYRDSKLTRLLQHALGGNSRTAVVCTISPNGGWHLEQTRGTLMFASRAIKVTNHARRNLEQDQDPGTSLLARHEKEIEALRSQLRTVRDTRAEGGAEEVQELQRKIEGMTRFILGNCFAEGPKTLSTPGTDPKDVRKEAGIAMPRVYTTLGLVSPSQEGARNPTSGAPSNAQLFSPLLEKYREARRQQQRELAALQDRLSSLKDARAKDKTLMQNQLRAVEREVDDFERKRAELEENSAAKDALLKDQSKLLEDQKRENANLRSLNERLCEEASKFKEACERESAILREVEKRQQEDMALAERSAAALEGQIAALEGALEKVGSKASLVSPAVRRAKELEEALAIKTTQLTNVEKTLAGTEAGQTSGPGRREGNQFDAKKLRRFSAMLETALAKMQGWTSQGRRSPLANSPSPNTPRLPQRASLTWEHFDTSKENEFRTPPLAEAALHFKEQELSSCVGDAMSACKLFKSQVELLYAALQEAEEANEGQQVLFSVVAQNEARKISQWEMERAAMKTDLQEMSAMVSLERQSKKDLAAELGARESEAQANLATLREDHANLLALLRKREASLLQMAKEKALQDAKRTGDEETLRFREDELRASVEAALQEDLENAMSLAEEDKQRALADMSEQHRVALASALVTKAKEAQVVIASMKADHSDELSCLRDEHSIAVSKLKEALTQAADDEKARLIELERSGAEKALNEQMAAFQRQAAKNKADALEKMKDSMEAALAEQVACVETTCGMARERALEEQKLALEQEGARILADALANQENALSFQHRDILENALEKQKNEIEERKSAENSSSISELRKALGEEFEHRLKMHLQDQQTRLMDDLNTRLEAEAEQLKWELQEQHQDNLERSLESLERELKKSFEEEKREIQGSMAAKAQVEMDSVLASQESSLALLENQLESLNAKFTRQLEQALADQKVSLSETASNELSEMLKQQKESLEAFAEEQKQNALADLTEQLVFEKNSALESLRESLEQQSREALESALEAKTAEAEDALASLKADYSNEISQLREGKAFEHEHYQALLSKLEAKSKVAEKVNFKAFAQAVAKSSSELSPKLLHLWETTFTPLVHRSLFLSALALAENRETLESLEFERIQWIQEFQSEVSPHQLEAHLEKEREDLLRRLRLLPNSVKEALLSAWGISGKVRKRRLVSRLFGPSEDPARSAQVVGLLMGTDKKITLSNFCSYYCMLAQDPQSPITSKVLSRIVDNDAGDDFRTIDFE